MKHCGEIISKEIERKHLLRKDLAAHLGHVPQNMKNILSKSNFDCRTLEKCCEFLGLDPADFFDYRPGHTSTGVKVGDIDQQVGIGTASVNFSAHERELLERLLDEKDARIRNLESSNRFLYGLLDKRKGSIEPAENISDGTDTE